MKLKLIKYFKELVLLILMITIFANIVSLYKSQDLNKTPLKQINLTLINGTHYTFPRKKPLLIHFWATWCPICKLEAPNIQIIANHYDVLSIAVKSGSDIFLEQYMKTHQLSYKIYNDEDGSLAREYKVPAYPTTFIYNTKGELVFSEVGYTSLWGLWLRMWWAS